MLAQSCPLPPQIKAMHLPGVLAAVQSGCPPWLQVIPACVVVYAWAMAYLVTGLVAKELAIPFICLFVNGVVAGIVLPHLKAAIAESRKTGGSGTLLRICFLLQLLQPVVAAVLFLTVGLETGAQVCAAAVVLGGGYVRHLVLLEAKRNVANNA